VDRLDSEYQRAVDARRSAEERQAASHDKARRELEVYPRIERELVSEISRFLAAMKRAGNRGSVKHWEEGGFWGRNVRYWPLRGSLCSEHQSVALDDRGKLRLIIRSHNPDWRIEESGRSRTPGSYETPSADEVAAWLAQALADNHVQL
jgi:hypothetical protein